MLFIYFLISLLIVIKGADWAIKYSTKISKDLKISKYIVGFILVAFFSIIPETLISILSALENNPSFGLGTLYGSDIADLTLIIAIVALASRHNIKIKGSLIKEFWPYITIALIPIILGLNGYYSRTEGIILILICFLFYLFTFQKNKREYEHLEPKITINYKNIFLFILSIGTILLGSYLTIKTGIQLANYLKISPIIISMFFVGLGTTLPEFSFSLEATKKNQDDLALGDILGTVITDITFVIGIMALINPFAFNPQIIYITGTFMVLAIILLFHFMQTERIITKKESLLLILFYLIFAITEFILNYHS